MTAQRSGTEAVRDLYLEWTASRIRGSQNDTESWGDLTAEPRGVDYIETRAAALSALWAVPKDCAEDRVLDGCSSRGSTRPTWRSPATPRVVGWRWPRSCAREQGLPLPAAALLISPWVDMQQSGESYKSNWATDAFFYKELVDGLAAMFLGPDGNATDPLASPWLEPLPDALSRPDASTPAVKSALQRARARLDEASPTPEDLIEPESRGAQELLGRYLQAFEHSDLAALEQVLVADATLEMTPARTWFADKRNCVGYIRRVIGPAGTWSMTPTVANGQPAALAYRRSDGGDYEPFAVVVLTVTTQGIARITLFSEPCLFSRFDMPESRAD